CARRALPGIGRKRKGADDQNRANACQVSKVSHPSRPLQERFIARSPAISAGATLQLDVRQPHVTSRRCDARLPFRSGNDAGAALYPRTRNASPRPTSAESPSSTTTPGKPASANTRPPQVTPTVPPRKLDVLTRPEPLPDWVAGSAASAMRGADA